MPRSGLVGSPYTKQPLPSCTSQQDTTAMWRWWSHLDMRTPPCKYRYTSTKSWRWYSHIDLQGTENKLLSQPDCMFQPHTRPMLRSLSLPSTRSPRYKQPYTWRRLAPWCCHTDQDRTGHCKQRLLELWYCRMCLLDMPCKHQRQTGCTFLQHTMRQC